MGYESLVCLVERAKQNDDDAFTQLYKMFTKSVYYMGLRLTKNKEDANDVVQETMLAFYQGLHTIDNPRAIGAYIKKLAFHQCTRILRKKKQTVSEDEINYDSLSFEETDEEFLPEKYLEQKEMHDYLVKQLDQLSEPLRAVMMLFYFERFSIAEIAKILDVSESAVGVRMHRAKHAMKKNINEKDVVRCAVPIPILTSILRAHADEVFTAELSISIWQNIAAKLGYSPEAIERTTAIIAAGATTAAVGVAATTATGVAATGAIATIKSVAASVSTYTMLAGAACFATVVGGAALVYQAVDIPIFESAAAVFSQAVSRNQTQDIISDTYIIGYDTALQAQILPYESMAAISHEVLDIAEETHDSTINSNASTQMVRGQHSVNTYTNGVVTRWQSETALPQIAMMREEGSYYVLADPNVPLALPRPPQQSVEMPPQITVSNNALTFTAGTNVTAEQILQYANITLNEFRQAVVSDLDKVDFNTPGKYPVLIQVIEGGRVLSQRVVIVEIVEMSLKENTE